MHSLERMLRVIQSGKFAFVRKSYLGKTNHIVVSRTPEKVTTLCGWWETTDRTAEVNPRERVCANCCRIAEKNGLIK